MRGPLPKFAAQISTSPQGGGYASAPAGRAVRMSSPLAKLLLALVAALVAWLFLAVWPDWLVAAIGPKKIFVNTIFNGVTLAGLYFLVASGFTLVFGLMRNVNLA